MRILSRHASSLALATGALVPLACGPAPRPEQPAPRPISRSRPMPGAVRIAPAAGGAIEFSLAPGDSFVTLAVADSVVPRAMVRIAPAMLHRFGEDVRALFTRRMPSGAARETWGVQIDDGSGDLALEITRLARLEGGQLRDSFALAARAPGAPVVLPLTPFELGETAEVARSYAAYLAIPGLGPAGAGARPYYSFEVDVPAMAVQNRCFPRYPILLRERGVTGEVIAEFVVGTDGRVEPGSFRAVRSSDRGFTESVERATACFRFTPAQADGRPVRQHGQQPFTFDIAWDR